jgi:hypothetical protein
MRGFLSPAVKTNPNESQARRRSNPLASHARGRVAARDELGEIAQPFARANSRMKSVRTRTQAMSTAL